MIAKAAVISHGANAVRYATEKDKSKIIKVNCLPDDIPSEGIWLSRSAFHTLLWAFLLPLCYTIFSIGYFLPALFG